jgi:hypothetical protein
MVFSFYGHITIVNVYNIYMLNKYSFTMHPKFLTCISTSFIIKKWITVEPV